MHKLEIFSVTYGNLIVETSYYNHIKLLSTVKLREIMTNYTDEAQEGVRTPGYLWHVSV